MRLTKTTYRCDLCNKEGRDKKNILNWLAVGVLRDEVAPTRCGKPRWRKDFCTTECLSLWAAAHPEVSR